MRDLSKQGIYSSFYNKKISINIGISFEKISDYIRGWRSKKHKESFDGGNTLDF